MSYVRAFDQLRNFDQWKTFSENYKPKREFNYGLFTNYQELSSFATLNRVHSNSKEVS